MPGRCQSTGGPSFSQVVLEGPGDECGKALDKLHHGVRVPVALEDGHAATPRSPVSGVMKKS